MVAMMFVPTELGVVVIRIVIMIAMVVTLVLVGMVAFPVGMLVVVYSIIQPKLWHIISRNTSQCTYPSQRVTKTVFHICRKRKK